MYLLSKFKLKKILILMLTFVMIVSVALATACGETDDDPDDDDTTTQTETTITDYQTIKNGDFEFSTKEDTKFPYSSSISWSKSTGSDNTSAPSSTITSGIIDTEDTAYNKLGEKEKPSYKDGEETKYINPRTPYYYGLVEDLYDYEDEDKQSNPQAKGSKILMIANKSSEEGVGTAQKFKSSSSIVVPIDGYALVSIWVKTVNLKSAYYSEGDFGAYISLTNKVGGNQYKDIYFENINTNNNWVKYETYIKGSDLSTTTFTLTVGLGHGNGTFTKNFVEGYAYFDNAQVKTFTKAEYNAVSNKGDETEIFDKDQENIFDLGDLAYTANPTEKATEYSKTEEENATVKKSFNYKKPIGTKTAVSGANPNYPDYILTNGYDLTGGGENKMATGLMNAIDTAPISEQLANVATDLDNSNPSLIYMSFKKASVASYLSDEITLKSKTYNYITFFAKTFGENPSDIAKAEIYDVVADKYYSAFATIDTADIEDGNYGTWDKYTIMVYNPTDTDTNYQIKLTFGCNTILKIEDQWVLQKGYAIFADLNYAELTYDDGKDIYDLISSGNVYKTSIYGKYTTFVEDNEDDSNDDVYAVTTDIQGNYDIKTKPITSIDQFSFVGSIPENCVTGIINSKYINANDSTKYGVDDATAKQIAGLDIFKSLTSEDNKYAQAVVIDNKASISTAYRSMKIDVTANSFRKISIRVKATGNAVANIYLIDLEGNPVSLSPINTTLKATVKADAPSVDGKWVDVSFYIASGNQDKTFRLEIWNGDKDAGSIGAIYFESVITTSVEETAFNMDKESYKVDFSEIDGYNFEIKSHTRPNATLKETVDGEVVESIKTFNPQEIYAGNQLVKFVSFATIDCDDVIDNTAEEDSEEPETESEEEGYTVSTDVALQISSIVIAVVLLGVMIAVLFRNNFKKKARKQGKIREYYGRDIREKALEKISQNKKEIKLADSNEEYDYEQAQLVDEEELPEEEVIEETEPENEEVVLETTDEVENEEVIEETSTETTEE